MSNVIQLPPTTATLRAGKYLEYIAELKHRSPLDCLLDVFQYLQDTGKTISQQERAACIRRAWWGTASDQRWRDTWIDLFRSVQPSDIMTKEEKQHLSELPDKTKLHRACYSEYDNTPGLAWIGDDWDAWDAYSAGYHQPSEEGDVYVIEGTKNGGDFTSQLQYNGPLSHDQQVWAYFADGGCEDGEYIVLPKAA